MVTGEGSGPVKVWRMMKEITFIKQEDVIQVIIRRGKNLCNKKAQIKNHISALKNKVEEISQKDQNDKELGILILAGIKTKR